MASSKLLNNNINNVDEYCLKGHQLELKYSINNSYFECDGCKERGFGVHYRCDRCNYDIHKECHGPLLTIQNHHFPGGVHDFHFLRNLPSKSQPRFCDACGKQILGYLYQCEERGWDLHPCCNNLFLNIQFNDKELILQVDDDELIMHERKSKTTCIHCKNTNLSGPGTHKGVPGWYYVSTCGDYWCHAYCLREMVMVMEIRRSLQTARLATAPVSRPRGVISSTTGEESWREALSVATTMTGFVLGDPTAILTAAFIQMFTG